MNKYYIRGEEMHGIWVDAILGIGILFFSAPYVLPLIMAHLLGGYKSGWDSSLGSCFGGGLGSGFGGFSGDSKRIGW